ncbi:hypothetical protein D3C87_1637440 [compost metagenome]
MFWVWNHQSSWRASFMESWSFWRLFLPTRISSPSLDTKRMGSVTGGAFLGCLCTGTGWISARISASSSTRSLTRIEVSTPSQ